MKTNIEMMSKKELTIYRGINRRRKKLKKVHWGAAIFLVLWSLYVFVPFYIMFNLATKTIHESTYSAFSWGWQEGFTLQGFQYVFVDTGLGITMLRGFFNTLLYTIPEVCVGLFVGTMAAYAWSKLKWKGRDQVFAYLMIGLMMPSSVGMTTRFLMWDSIGLVGTVVPIMLPGMFCGISQIFFIKQYMTAIPDELMEAAKIDGMNDVTSFFKIILPLSLPAIFTQVLFCFIGGYNEYLGPLIYLDDPSMFTLQIALRFYQSQYADNTAAVMAAAFVAILPLLVLYFFLQKYILKGLNMGSGLKG